MKISVWEKDQEVSENTRGMNSNGEISINIFKCNWAAGEVQIKLTWLQSESFNTNYQSIKDRSEAERLSAVETI